MNFIPLATISNQTVVIVPRHAGQILRLDDVEYTAAADEEPMRVTGTGQVSLGDGWWDLATIVDGEYDGRPFAGGSPVRGRVRTRWLGEAGASESVLETQEFVTYA